MSNAGCQGSNNQSGCPAEMQFRMEPQIPVERDENQFMIFLIIAVLTILFMLSLFLVTKDSAEGTDENLERDYYFNNVLAKRGKPVFKKKLFMYNLKKESESDLPHEKLTSFESYDHEDEEIKETCNELEKITSNNTFKNKIVGMSNYEPQCRNRGLFKLALDKNRQDRQYRSYNDSRSPPRGRLSFQVPLKQKNIKKN